MDYDFFPFNVKGRKDIELVLRKDNKAVTRVDYSEGGRKYDPSTFGIKPWLCGYVALPKTVLPMEWFEDDQADSLDGVDAHGGITYRSINKEYIVFGFDCGHAGDEEKARLHDPKFVMGLVEEMERSLMAEAERMMGA